MKNILIIAIFLFAVFSPVLLKNLSLAEELPVKAPENLQEAKNVGEKALDAAKNDLPDIIKNIWQNEVLPVWKKIGEYLKKFWDSYLKNVWEKLKNIFRKEINERNPALNEEFEKEKTEMREGLKTEVPLTGKSLWEKLKGLIQ